MIDTTINGELNATALVVGGSLLMRAGDQKQSSFGKVNLSLARVALHLDASGAKLRGKFTASHSTVGSSLIFRRTTISGLDIEGARISENLIAASATLTAHLMPVA